MKKIQLLILLLTLSFFTFAQTVTLSLSDSQGPILDGGSRTYTTSANIAFTGEMMVNNTGSSDLSNVICIKEIIDTIPGTESYYCWGSCYTAQVDTSLDIVLIPAGNSETFSPEYNPHGNIGESHVRFVFYQEGNPENRIFYIATFKAEPVSVNNYAQNNNKIGISPNPASNLINIDYSLQDNINSVMIKNMLGAVVYTANVSMSNGRISINSSEFVDGIYFVTFASNGTPVNTKKVIVKH